MFHQARMSKLILLVLRYQSNLGIQFLLQSLDMFRILLLSRHLRILPEFSSPHIDEINELVADGLVGISLEYLQAILYFLYNIKATLKEGISILTSSFLVELPSPAILFYLCNELVSLLKLYILT